MGQIWVARMRILWLVLGLAPGCHTGPGDTLIEPSFDSGFPIRDTASPRPDDGALDADCPPQLSVACHIEAGVCVDEGTTLAVPVFDAATIAAVRSAHQAGSCAAEVLAPCALDDGSTGVAHAWGAEKGAAVDVFDARGAWVAGWVPAGPQLSYVDCGERWWLGSVRWRMCADQALGALAALGGSCVDAGAACTVEACLSDGL